MKHTEYIIPIGEAEDFDEIFIGVIRKHDELIRCKNCKFCQSFYHGPDSNLGIISYFCLLGCSDITADDYCSYGKKKEKD